MWRSCSARRTTNSMLSHRSLLGFPQGEKTSDSVPVLLQQGLPPLQLVLIELLPGGAREVRGSQRPLGDPLLVVAPPEPFEGGVGDPIGDQGGAPPLHHDHPATVPPSFGSPHRTPAPPGLRDQLAGGEIGRRPKRLPGYSSPYLGGAGADPACTARAHPVRLARPRLGRSGPRGQSPRAPPRGVPRLGGSGERHTWVSGRVGGARSPCRLWAGEG